MTRLEDVLRVLLYGKDGRTDALAEACRDSAARPELFAYTEFPSPGLREKCRDVRVASLNDCKEMISYAREVQPHLVIVGPEEPLAAGLADALELLKVPCFGPHSSLARIETSKSWTRRLLDKHGIPGNPRYRIFDASDDVEAYLRELGDFVVKPDGLTGGKGVKVLGEHLDSIEDAAEYANSMIWRDGRVLIEERLDGEEFSLQSIADGDTIVHCPIVQDHKRAREGDTGPNTGGVGSYSCPDFSLPFLDTDDVAQAKRINEAVAEALRNETGRPYRGVLYGGFIATRDGIRLIEYNARFGDPEVLNLVPILRTDFVELARATTAGTLAEVDVAFEPKATVCKYVVPDGYPDDKRIGDEIHFDDAAFRRLEGVSCYWAAVNQQESRILMTGSRAVAVVGVGDTLAEAEHRAEQGVGCISGPVAHRSDIGQADRIDARMRHMASLRTGPTGA